MNNMSIIYLLIFLLRLLHCIHARENISKDDVMTPNSKQRREILNYQEIQYDTKTQDYKTRTIKFQDDSSDPKVKLKKEYGNDNFLSSVFFETDPNPNLQNMLIFSNNNPGAKSKSEENFKYTINEGDFKGTLINLHDYSEKQEQRNTKVNDYIKFKDNDKKSQVVFENSEDIGMSDELINENAKNLKNQLFFNVDQDISDKPVVFGDNDKKIDINENKYWPSDSLSTSKNKPGNYNFHYSNTEIPKNANSLDSYKGYSRYSPIQYAAGIPGYSPGSTNLAFPEQNNQMSQSSSKATTQKYPGTVLQKPGLYPGQWNTGHTHSDYGYAGTPTGLYRPPIHPMSLAQRAISAITEALTSIALYDDKQCVPRLLCEVSTGSTPRSPSLLKASAALGPLLTLLQSYNGISSSPLFIFGRAAILGATSKGNPTTCRYAYPQCPNDPDKLINYLNNHNGGFFRFFGQPQKQQQQNLEQFYHQLSGQYGNFQQQGQQQINNGQPYAFQNPYNNYHEPKSQNTLSIDNEISATDTEERIQNKPIRNYLEEEINEDESKWRFPDELSYETEGYTTERENKRKPKRIKTANNDGIINVFKFPDNIKLLGDIVDNNDNRDFSRKQKVLFFPGGNNYYLQTNVESTTPNLDEYVFDNKHNFFVKRQKNIVNNIENDKTQILYIVRGNGDPRYPEIVRHI